MSGRQIATVMTVLALGARLVAAQQPAQPNRGGMMADTAMAQQQMKMMDSMNLRLDSLVTRMNQVSGNKKVAAMADVINELVAQRRAMQQHMHKMMERRGGMMGEMMGESLPSKRPPMVRPESSSVDTGHAGHHPTP
jgi:hypothetical protein